MRRAEYNCTMSRNHPAHPPKPYEHAWYFTSRWSRGNHSGIGRRWKRRLAKLRRRAWRDERHPRGLVGMESTVNYKTW